MDYVDIGVFAYNEEKIIKNNLRSILKQEENGFKINKIFVFSDSSTDNTEKIVKELSESDRRIKLYSNKNRIGKGRTINKFLKLAESELLIISSADIILKKDCIQYLIKNLNRENVGLVVAHPISIPNSNTLMSKVSTFQWRFLDIISEEKPKFGELIGLKKVIEKIPHPSVDEEEIAKLILEKGFLITYERDAIVYNSPPKTISDFLKQRRRIYCGHLELKNKKNYEVPTLSNLSLLMKFFKHMNHFNLRIALISGVLEIFARFLGVIDYITNKKKHYVWEKIER
ncbi:MAG: glycosyltransferase [archaeon]